MGLHVLRNILNTWEWYLKLTIEYLRIIANTAPKTWSIIMHSNLSRQRIASIGVYLNHPPVKTCVPSIEWGIGPLLLWHGNTKSDRFGLIKIYLQSGTSVYPCTFKYILMKFLPKCASISLSNEVFELILFW